MTEKKWHNGRLLEKRGPSLVHRRCGGVVMSTVEGYQSNSRGKSGQKWERLFPDHLFYTQKRVQIILALSVLDPWILGNNSASYFKNEASMIYRS